MIEVLLADDHSILRRRASPPIQESGEIVVVAEASDGKEALLMAEKQIS